MHGPGLVQEHLLPFRRRQVEFIHHLAREHGEMLRRLGDSVFIIH